MKWVYSYFSVIIVEIIRTLSRMDGAFLVVFGGSVYISVYSVNLVLLLRIFWLRKVKVHERSCMVVGLQTLTITRVLVVRVFQHSRMSYARCSFL